MGNNLAEVLKEYISEAECQRRWTAGWMIGGFTYHFREEILKRGGMWFGRHKVWMLPSAMSNQEFRALFPGDF